MSKIYIIILLLILLSLISFLRYTKKIDKFTTTKTSLYNTKNGAITLDNLLIIDNGNINNLTANSINILPDDFIIPFIGTTIPDGWVICDGKTYTRMADARYPEKTITTPDLTHKFLKGDTKPGTFIGTDDITLNINTMPSHSHSDNSPQSYFNGGSGENNGMGYCTPFGSNCKSNPWYIPANYGSTFATGNPNPLSFSIVPGYTTVIYLLRFEGYKHPISTIKNKK